MRTLFLFVVSFLLAGCCSAPPPAPLFPPGPTVSAAAGILGHGQPAMAGAHRQDRLDALEAHKLTGNDLVDRRSFIQIEGAVDARWMPVWQQMRQLWVAYEGYRTTKARGEKPSEEELQKALCALRAVVPPKWEPAVLPKIEGCG